MTDLHPIDQHVIDAASEIVRAVHAEVRARREGAVPASCVSTRLYTAAVNLSVVMENAGHPITKATTEDTLLRARVAVLEREMRRYLPVIEAAEADPELWGDLTAATGIATANGYRAALDTQPATP